MFGQKKILRPPEGGLGSADAAASAFSFATSFSIGRIVIPNRVVLAPMAGLTNSAYRRHLKAHGAGLVTTEMVSAYGLLHGNKRTTEDYLRFADEGPDAIVEGPSRFRDVERAEDDRSGCRLPCRERRRQRQRGRDRFASPAPEDPEGPRRPDSER